MILLHVIIALASIGMAGYNLLRPSKTRLRLNYLLIASTLASGTYLVVDAHAPMLQACVSGLVYLAIVSSGIIPAKIRLAGQR
jgi:hypothetical protein